MSVSRVVSFDDGFYSFVWHKLLQHRLHREMSPFPAEHGREFLIGLPALWMAWMERDAIAPQVH